MDSFLKIVVEVHKHAHPSPSPTHPQDTFREQLCAGAKAVVDECVGKGIVDPKRVSVGGRECWRVLVQAKLARACVYVCLRGGMGVD